MFNFFVELSRKRFFYLVLTIGLALLILLFFTLTSSEKNPICSPLEYDGNRYTVCKFDPHTHIMGLYWRNDNAQPITNMSALVEYLRTKNKTLIFAMNAGMYNQVLAPIGLYIQDHHTYRKINTKDGYGNFHLKPNGVFYFDKNQIGVLDTDTFIRAKLNPSFATQSGPMLVINNHIHPQFSASGSSLKIRNGVGVDKSGKAFFLISQEPVSFYDFASVFKQHLRTPNALFLDGTVSTLYAPPFPTQGNRHPLGPMIGITKR